MTRPIPRSHDPLGGQAVDPELAETLRRRRGGGEPLPTGLGDQLGAQLGTDVSDIRVHTDQQAGAIARSLQATAFTTGNDLYFAPGAYRPGSPDGLHTLTHELAHVVQQRSGLDAGTGPLRVGAADDPLEAGADRIADRTLAALHGPRSPSEDRADPDRRPADSPRVRRTLAALHVGPLRRKWSDEQVYSTVRDLIPQLRQQLAGIGDIADPWKRSYEAAALLRTVQGHADEGRTGGQYRLSRTLDTAIGAVDSLDALALQVQACAAEADLAIKLRQEHVGRQLGRFEEVEGEVETILGRLKEISGELSVSFNRPSQLTSQVGEAERTVGSELNVSDDQLDELIALASKEQAAYRAELDRLLEAKPVLEAFLQAKFDAEDTIGYIAELATGTEWNSKKITKEISNVRLRIADALKNTKAARSLLTDDPLPVLRTATKKLIEIYQEISDDDNEALGAMAEEARDRQNRATGSTKAKGQRTSLPVLKASVATGARAQMLPQAVKESQKSPEWKQVAVDFVMDRLALGRPDHIHICGGGNTLIYDGRLIRGYMTEHLDSRKESQLQANKIKGRDRTNPVTVTVQSGVLYEVIPG